MADANRDNNSVPGMLGTSNADGSTLVRIKANPTTHNLSVADGSSGSDHGGNPARRDNNGVVAMLAASSTDGSTPVAIYADPATGELLIKST